MIGSVDLLRKLASGVRPDGVATPEAPHLIERERFESLLARVRTGELSSGQPLRLERDSEIELDDDTLARLSDATDAAHAAGMERLLAWVGEHVLRIDVAQRTASQDSAAREGGLITGFDAAVVISNDAQEPPRIVAGPTGLPNAGLADALARGVRSGSGTAGVERAAG